jgi:hypothetical protein
MFIAHALAYPIALAWALASIPIIIFSIASVQYEDAEIARRVLAYTLWPSLLAFAAAHVPGAVWAWSRNDARGRRHFLSGMIVLGALPTVVGGVLWGWLMLQ